MWVIVGSRGGGGVQEITRHEPSKFNQGLELDKWLSGLMVCSHVIKYFRQDGGQRVSGGGGGGVMIGVDHFGSVACRD